MSGPPPGYNPQDSLLQGGTSAQIHAVQGGGGGGGGVIPTNPDISLLAGGETSQIHAVQGGGAGDSAADSAAFTLRAAFQARGGTAAAAAAPGFRALPSQPSSLAIRIEEVTLPSSSADIPLPSDARNEYLNRRRPLWKRIQADTTKEADDQTARPLSVDKCKIISKSTDDNMGEGGYDRLAVILPVTTASIVVFPPIKGDIDLLKRYITHIKNNKKDDAVFILSSPVYDSTDKTLNANIFQHIMALIAENPNVYAPCAHTPLSRHVGCAHLTNDSMFRLDPVINFAEPTYILFPFARTLKEEGGTEKQIGGLLFTAAAEGEADLVACNQPLRLSSVGSFINKGGRGSIAFPPDIKKKDMQLESFRPFQIINVHLPAAAAAAMPPPIKRYILRAAAAAPAVREAAAGMTIPLAPDGFPIRFEPAPVDVLALDFVNYRPVRLGPLEYSMRRPANQLNDEVFRDWVEAQFTRDEAKFLNDLNLRPWILNEIFGDGWKKTLADFLYTTVSSNCFRNTSILSFQRCFNARAFLSKVGEFFLSHDQRIAGMTGAERAAINKTIFRDLESSRDYIAGLKETGQALESKTRELRRLYDAAKASVEKAAETAAAEKRKDDAAAAAAAKSPFARGDAAADSGRLGKGQGGGAVQLGTDPIVRDAYAPTVYSRQFIGIEKKTGEYRRGYIEIDGAETGLGDDQVRQMLDEKLARLRQEYPGWIFLT